MSTNGSKLGVRERGRLLVLGTAEADPASVVGELPGAAELLTENRGGADVVLLFAADVAEVHADAEVAWSSVADGGRLWIAYRKGAGPAALNRDTLQAALADHGLVGVTLVSLDGTWSAMRVRPL